VPKEQREPFLAHSKTANGGIQPWKIPRLHIMGLVYNTYLNADKIFGCKHCKTHLASHDAIISRVRPPLSPHPPITPLFPLSTVPAPILTPLLPQAPQDLTPSSLPQNFRGQHGKAYLFSAVVNVAQAEATERNMTTGRHIVRDITCRQCKETVGWKYDKAYEASEKYKEGKYILEAELLCTVY